MPANWKAQPHSEYRVLARSVATAADVRPSRAATVGPAQHARPTKPAVAWRPDPEDVARPRSFEAELDRCQAHLTLVVTDH